jgi:hypothetical protein
VSSAIALSRQGGQQVMTAAGLSRSKQSWRRAARPGRCRFDWFDLGCYRTSDWNISDARAIVLPVANGRDRQPSVDAATEAGAGGRVFPRDVRATRHEAARPGGVTSRELGRYYPQTTRAHCTNDGQYALGLAAGRSRRPIAYFPNLESSIGALTLTSFSFALNRPSSHENLYSNGNLMPLTSR